MHVKINLKSFDRNNVLHLSRNINRDVGANVSELLSQACRALNKLHALDSADYAHYLGDLNVQVESLLTL